MEDLCIDTKLLPKGSSAFVFGSCLSRSTPRDLDLLIVYDASICRAKEAYRAHASFVASLQEMVGIPIDVILLTIVEEAHSSFVECSHAVPIERVSSKSVLPSETASGEDCDFEL